MPQVHQQRGGPVGFDNNAPALARGPPDIELLAGHYLTTLIRTGKDLFQVPGGALRSEKMRRLHQHKILCQEAPDGFASTPCFKGPDKFQDVLPWRGFRRVQFSHGFDTS